VIKTWEAQVGQFLLGCKCPVSRFLPGRAKDLSAPLMGTGSFLGVKRPGRGVDHPPPSSAEVKERVELYIYSPSGPSWPVLGSTVPLPLMFQSLRQEWRKST
jgi:hypothetical protein